MDRIVGIDYGRKRVGVAASDPLGIFASALDTVQSAKIIDYLKKYMENENVVLFVVGYPINMDGSIGPRAEKISNFSKKLEERFSLPVKFVDERCTTMIAHSILNQTNTRGKKRKSVVDTLSAEIILQSYLDSDRK